MSNEAVVVAKYLAVADLAKNLGGTVKPVEEAGWFAVSVSGQESVMNNLDYAHTFLLGIGTGKKIAREM